MVLVAIQNLKGDRQERDPRGRLGLLPLGEDPPLPVHALPDLRALELLHVHVGKAGVAAKEEHVPHLAQPVGDELLFRHPLQLGLGEALAHHLSLAHLEAQEGVALQPAVLETDVNNLLEVGQVLYRRVVGTVSDCLEPELVVGDKLIGELLHVDVLRAELPLDKVPCVLQGGAVAVHGPRGIVLPHQFAHLLIVHAEHLQQ